MLSLLIRFGASFVCGFLLGVERKVRSHAVGIRTLVLISISSTLLSILSVKMADCGLITGDPTRIAAGVVTGIGFIGGGAILRQGMNIRGLTSAAIIFAAAALGLACGFELYLPAAVTLFVCLFTLVFMEKLERRLFPAEKTKFLRLRFSADGVDEADIHRQVSDTGIIIMDVFLEFSGSKISEITYLIKYPDNLDTSAVVKSLSQIKSLSDFSLTS